MLVLSRKLEEKVVIVVPPSAMSRRVVVQITGIKGPYIRLGFEADATVKIDREEVAFKPKEN